MCSVSYTTVDDAIKQINKLGKNCLLAKTDTAAAFRILPVHPDDHELLGIQFNGSFFMTAAYQWGVQYLAPFLKHLTQPYNG